MKKLAFSPFFLFLIFACFPSGSGAAPPVPLLPNPGFERASGQDAAGWDRFEAGYVRDSAAGRGGGIALRCENRTREEARGAVTTLVLDQKSVAPIRITGWSRAQGVSGTANPDYAIYVDAELADGSPLWGASASFATGTHDWRRAAVTVQASQPIKSLKIHALFRRHTGTVWFDDFTARELTGADIFDAQAIAAPLLPANQTSGWFVRDVAADGPMQRVTPGGAMVNGLRLTLVSSPKEATPLRVVLQGDKTRSRALTLYYVERFADDKPMWWRDLQRAEPAGDSDRSETERMATVGATGTIARFPIACITGAKTGRFLAVPPDAGACVFRLGYHPLSHLLYAAFDVGLTAERPTAQAALLYGAADAEWGLRDAWRRYMAKYPDYYTRRATAEGIWMPFTDPATVKDAADFGFAYHEGDNSVTSDEMRGVLSFSYTEPMTFWMNLPKDAPREYDFSLNYLKKIASGEIKSEAKEQLAARAALATPTEDENGGRNGEIRKEPWADGMVWVLNPNPLLSGAMTQARRNFDPEDAKKRYESGALDGEYLDSLEGWAEVRDFRPENLRASAASLTFAADSYRPCIPAWFSVWEFTDALRRDLHQRKKLLFANSTPWTIPTLMPLLDVAGTETNWLEELEGDDILGRRRMLSGKKPYLLLQNTDYDKFDAAKAENYFRRCLFWSVYPSFFSQNAADHPYWETPKWYERDRPLFKKYLPLIQRCSAAGWEPVTHARADKGKIRVERYGTEYFTVRADSGQEEQGEITINLAALRGNRAVHAGERCRVTELLSGKILANFPAQMSVRVPVKIGAGEVLVLRLTP